MRGFREGLMRGFLIAVRFNAELLLDYWIEPLNITTHYRSSLKSLGAIVQRNICNTKGQALAAPLKVKKSKLKQT